MRAGEPGTRVEVLADSMLGGNGPEFSALKVSTRAGVVRIRARKTIVVLMYRGTAMASLQKVSWTCCLRRRFGLMEPSIASMHLLPRAEHPREPAGIRRLTMACSSVFG
jgi:hypothetical protein